MKKILLCILLLNAMVYAKETSSDEVPSVLGDFLSILKTLECNEDIKISSKPTKVDLATWRGECKMIDASLPLLMRLWIVGGHEDFIQLAWWRK